MKSVKDMTLKEFVSQESAKQYAHWFDYFWANKEDIPADITLEETARKFFGGTGFRADRTAEAVLWGAEKQYTVVDEKRKVGYIACTVDKPRGTIFILPGGGYWNICAYEEGFLLAKIANDHGFTAIITSYGVREFAKMPGPIEDFGNVIKHVYSNIKEGITKDYEIVGCSASGHLCAMFAEKEHGYLAQGLNKPKKVILMYPVIDFGPNAHIGSKANSLMELKDDPKTQQEYSAQLHVDGDYPPTFISRGKDDEIVPVINTEVFVDALNKAGVKNTKFIANSVHHGYAACWDENKHSWFEDALEWNE